jgi:ribonuclease E
VRTQREPRQTDERPIRPERQERAPHPKPTLETETDELESNLPEQNDAQDDNSTDEERPRRRSRGQRRRSNRRERQQVDVDGNAIDDSSAENAPAPTESTAQPVETVTDAGVTEKTPVRTAPTLPATAAVVVPATTDVKPVVVDAAAGRGAVAMVDPAQTVSLSADQPLLQISEPSAAPVAVEMPKASPVRQQQAEKSVVVTPVSEAVTEVKAAAPIVEQKAAATVAQPKAEPVKAEPVAKVEPAVSNDTASLPAKAPEVVAEVAAKSEVKAEAVATPAPAKTVADKAAQQPARPVGRASNDPRERRRLERLAREAEAAQTAPPKAAVAPAVQAELPVADVKSIAAPVEPVVEPSVTPTEPVATKQDVPSSPAVPAETEHNQTAAKQTQSSKHDDAPAAEQDETKPHA